MSRGGVAALALLAALARSTTAAEPHTAVHWVMGTWLRIVASGDAAQAAMAACFADARLLDRTFSRWDPGSELSALHAGAAAGAVVRVSPAMAALTARSLVLRDRTGGAFDPAVGPLTALHRVPGDAAPAALAAARAASAATVTLDGDRLTLPPGARLDFDGVAKGFAVDRCVERLRAAGVTRALVSLGESSVAAVGAPAGAPAWMLAVRGVDPDTTVGTLELRDAALSVSATHGGPGHGEPHIVDPHSGRLLREAAVGVVVAASATDAEAFSKALLVWGPGGTGRVETAGATGALAVRARGLDVGPGLAATGAFRPFATPRRLTAAEEPLR